MKTATLDKYGNYVSTTSFAERRRLKDLVSKEEYAKILKEIRNKPDTDLLSADFADKENPGVYDWVVVGDDKYNKLMYCLKTGNIRSQTMGEFYENSIVD